MVKNCFDWIIKMFYHFNLSEYYYTYTIKLIKLSKIQEKLSIINITYGKCIVIVHNINQSMSNIIQNLIQHFL